MKSQNCTFVFVRRIYKYILILAFAPIVSLAAQDQHPIPYTLDDRDRAIRTEAKIEILATGIASFEKTADIKSESVNGRLDYVFWLQGVIVALILFMLGYTIWDRRTALKPALDKVTIVEERNSTLVRALRDYAQNHPELARILK